MMDLDNIIGIFLAMVLVFLSLRLHVDSTLGLAVGIPLFILAVLTYSIGNSLSGSLAIVAYYSILSGVVLTFLFSLRKARDGREKRYFGDLQPYVSYLQDLLLRRFHIK